MFQIGNGSNIDGATVICGIWNVTISLMLVIDTLWF